MTSAETRFQGLSEFVSEAMARYGVPGVAVGVLYDGQAHTAGFGVTSVENPLPVDGDTLFQIGSTTKTFTGTAVMRLVEMGRLALDEPIRTYLPGLRLSSEDVTKTVSLRHLLTHTSGWVGDYFEDFGPGDDAIARYAARMADLPQLTPPGAVWSYNNAGFWLAGRVIEVVTGQTWEAALKDLVIDPLGLTRSFFFADEVITYRFAVGHHVHPNRAVVARRWSYPRRRPSGAIISTARDQLRYARFQMGDGAAEDGTRLLTPESIRLMQTPYVARDLVGGSTGVTWMIDDLDGTRLVMHGGATNGQMSAFLMAPARGFAITVLTNADRGAALHREVTRWALRHYLGLIEPEPQLMALPPEQMASYAGRYATPDCALNIALPDIELSLGDGGLTARFYPRGGYPTRDSPQPAPPPTRVAFCATDRVFALDPPHEGTEGEFLRDAQGEVRWLRWGGRVRVRADTRSP
ncbi:MAG: beta-lactamase family protein [Chloroflexi bacterium]|nr:beta-lactamase family protein [Chloroflexota bacterium]